MKCNVTNRTGGVRKFAGGGRNLTLAGGEIERNVELSDAEAKALRDTGEFHVTEVKAAEKSAPAPAPGPSTEPAPKKS